MTRVAFIGLGTMGLPMARRLVAAGHRVVGCDLDSARAEALGAPVSTTPAEAVAGAQVVIASLPSPSAVEEVALGDDGIRAAGQPGAVFIDMSTGPPMLARRLAAELGAAGIDSLDAPVSGGPRGAEAGSLTIMVGGGEEVLERCRPLLAALGSLVVLVGGPGAGQAAKLCNNLIAGVTMAAIAEACAIAEREGIDPRTLYGLLTSSTGDSRVLRTRFPLPGVDASHPSSNGYEPLFMLDLIAKDLALAHELAVEHDVPARLAAAALREYRAAQEAGFGRLDYSAVSLSKRG
jgi:3-hydroxyisobutyrate dehydrogenase